MQYQTLLHLPYGIRSIALATDDPSSCFMQRTSGQCMERNACSMYLILAILVGVFAALDFVIGFGLVFLSTKLSTRSVNSIRCG